MSDAMPNDTLISLHNHRIDKTFSLWANSKFLKAKSKYFEAALSSGFVEQEGLVAEDVEEFGEDSGQPDSDDEGDEA